LVQVADLESKLALSERRLEEKEHKLEIVEKERNTFKQVS
jgi:hypothetical protein